MAQRNPTAKTAPRKPRKAKQPYLPGAEDMAPASIPEIDGAAADYVEARDGRMRLLKKEIECGAELLRLMHEHSQREYEYEGQIVTIAMLEKIKVKRIKGESNGEAE